MEEFAEYVKRVASIVQRLTEGRRQIETAAITPILDGEPSRELRKLVSLETRRRDGAFFTGSILADRIGKDVSRTIDRKSVVYDPACGAGDLLLGCARYSKTPQSPDAMLELWSTQFRGCDINKEFVKLARLRFFLQAIVKGNRRQALTRMSKSALPHIECGDGLLNNSALSEATHIVTNPPFSMMPAPDSCDWSSGNVNAAAVFLDVITREASPGTCIYAVLPDVIRSGSRYARLRRAIELRLAKLSVDIIGRFDNFADVDVVILKGVKRRSDSTGGSRGVIQSNKVDVRTVGDSFNVSVGSVVPHRHPQKGPWRPYLTTESCPPWTLLREPPGQRRFQGRVHKSPMVVVRRTSSPSDSPRAKGTLIALPTESAVENHLIVLTPKSGRISDCRQLLTILKSDATTDSLNTAIRCRHLTVSAIRSIPWPKNL